jgi:rhamnogalacturonan lyase-like protein
MVVAVRKESAVRFPPHTTRSTRAAFDGHRGGTEVNASPITSSTTYLDAGAAADATYTVRAVVDGVEQPASGASQAFGAGYRDVPIQTARKLPTLMRDPRHRTAIAWQNTAHDQPPHPSPLLGGGMTTPPWPDVHYAR